MLRDVDGGDQHPMSSSPLVAPIGEDIAARIAALRHRVDGDVLTASDPGFEEAIAAWNRNTAHHPAVVVLADNVGDVIATVTFAAELGIGLGVQATGHGGVLAVDGVLLVTSRLQDVCVDAEERTAWVAAGCTWADVVAASQVHGLAPLTGTSPTVGAVGSTLGGGLGWLARRFGPACDAVRSFEVVTPDGSLARVCGDENGELFRALRGGAAPLGVVTDMEIELVPLTTVYAGNLHYAADRAIEVIERYAAWVAQAPPELTTTVVLTNHPSPAVIIRGCWSGDVDAGRACIDSWRAAMPPELDTWAEMPFVDVATVSNDPPDPQPRVMTGAWLDRLDAEVATTLAAAVFAEGDAPALRFAEVRHAGGAIAAGDRSNSTMGHRDLPFLVQLVGVTSATNTASAIRREQQSVKDALDLPGPTYLNFLEGDERREGARTSIDPDDFAAIVDLRRELDPDGIMRFGVEYA
jgi:FAD/FMN-containing dehydrogenase